MSDQYNDFRCYASEIILQLFENKQVKQLELLKILIDQSLKELKKK